MILIFQLTRPLRGATVNVLAEFFQKSISTHTPLAGRDVSDVGSAGSTSDFNSHAPCGARQRPRPLFSRAPHFNSHAPCGARQCDVGENDYCGHFNSHAPCGARPADRRWIGVIQIFQLTRPLRGATTIILSHYRITTFQLTRPLRGATATDRGY